MEERDEATAQHRAQLHFEDLTVGETFPFGSWTFDREAIVEFAERYDPQSFHIDEATAEESLFDGLVASGWHTVAVCNRLIIDDVFGDIAVMGGTGTDDLRWPNPVRPGDTIEGTVRIDATRASGYDESGLVEMAITATNQADEPVLTMVNTVVVRREGYSPDDTNG